MNKTTWTPVACLLTVAWMEAATPAEIAPPWTEARAPRKLSIRPEKLPGAGIAGRAPEKADYRVPRAGKMQIDAQFEDWAGAHWIIMSGEPYHFGDNFEKLLNIELPADFKPAAITDPHAFFGLTYDEVDPELMDNYFLDEISYLVV
jgi:hypothetical protein